MLKYTVKRLVSANEQKLLKSIADLRFGTMYGVDIPRQDQTILLELDKDEIDLIDFVRDCQYIDVLTIHAGKATLAETDFKLNGFQCRRKQKFPTAKAEG